jgi:hypothetical protein
MELHAVLKSDLATLLRANLPATTALFFRYNYPDLAPENRKQFLNELLGLVEHSNHVLPIFNAMLRFRRMRSLQKFAALHGSIHNHFNQERTLISRQIFKNRRTAALTAWHQLCTA